MPSAQEPEYFGVTRVVGPLGGPVPVVLSEGGESLPGGPSSSEQLLAAVDELRIAVSSLTRAVGFSLPGVSGWPVIEPRQTNPALLVAEVRQATAANLIAEVRQPTAANLNVSLAANTNLATLASLTNQVQIGGIPANDYMPALMRMQTAALRNNVIVT